MEVNDIFKELAVMVHDQGYVVDSIEASVEKTEVAVGRGVTELRQAAQYTVTTHRLANKVFGNNFSNIPKSVYVHNNFALIMASKQMPHLPPYKVI